MVVPSSGFRVLVTGGDGFVGRYLVKTLHAKLPVDHEIIVGTLASNALNGNGPVRRIALDVTNPANIRAVLQKERPTHLFHLAAIAALDAARNDLRQTWAINFSGALNVAIGIMENAPECRLLFCSSGQIYGASFRSGEPLNESAPLDPIDAYGASKAAADVMLGQMAKRGLRAIRLRPFNHTGVGQGSGFVVPDFAAQIAAIERGEQKPVITVGNLDSWRDLMDVNDVVDAYVRCVLRFDQLAPGSALNVASGEAISV